MRTSVCKIVTLSQSEYDDLLIKDNKCLIIDPGDEIDKIIKEIKDLIPVGIIITHYHFDHIGAINIKDYYNINVYDINNLNEGINNIDDFNFEVIYTEGHSNTGISIYFKKEKIMFTGDFLFKGCIGRTDLDDSNENDMNFSINKIKKYDRDIKIYPGHGETTILKDELINNIYLKIIEEYLNQTFCGDSDTSTIHFLRL